MSNLLKSVNYAYPTSPNARKMGVLTKGGWSVGLAVPGKPSEIHAGPFNTKAEAMEVAEALPNKWCAFQNPDNNIF